jgi:asparagine synthase (glutamine-hydrolysing)
MLWTTPESLTERLPTISRNGEIAITADARIDNRAELIDALGLGDPANQQAGDSGLILAAYARWGERCLEHLDGDFAFAVWDGRRRALFCARDHFGVKPFYYHRSPRLFAFGSEIKALLKLAEVPQRLSELRVADYLAPVLEDKAITFYEEIFRLPPAHAMTVTPDRAEVRSYWTLDPGRVLALGSDEAYAEAFRELFTRAVRDRLRGLERVGSMLSGGLDSSSIVCSARQLLAKTAGPKLYTFSAVFPDLPECDERPFIQAVLNGNGLEPQVVRGDCLSPLGDLEQVLEQQDEAFFAPNLFMHRALYSCARERGIRVMLDGFDGDTTLWPGLTYLSELLRAGRWRTLVGEIDGLSRQFRRSRWRFLRTSFAPLVPPLVKRARRRLHVGARVDGALNPTIHPNFARRIGLTERVRDLTRERARPMRTAREEHWLRLTSGLFPTVLEEMDRAAAALSLEPRYPFFDRRLVEFCLALPPEQKLWRGWTRVVMRRAMTDILPSEVQWRGKANLSPVLVHGLLKFERERIERVIAGPKAIREYVAVPALQEAFARYICSGRDDPALGVWRASILAHWLEGARLVP